MCVMDGHHRTQPTYSSVHGLEMEWGGRWSRCGRMRSGASRCLISFCKLMWEGREWPVGLTFHRHSLPRLNAINDYLKKVSERISRVCTF